MNGYYWKLSVGKGYNPDQPRVPAGDPRGGQWTSAGTSSTIRTGGPRDKFDYTTWWGDQDRVTLFHGTSVENYEKIRQEGIIPSSLGHTLGKTYFSSSPTQAWMYSVTGGEVESGGYARLEPKERVVITLKVPPQFLSVTGVGNDRQSFQRIMDYVKANPSEGTDWIMLEFTTNNPIPPEMIVDAFRYPGEKTKAGRKRWEEWTRG